MHQKKIVFPSNFLLIANILLYFILQNSHKFTLSGIKDTFLFEWGKFRDNIFLQCHIYPHCYWYVTNDKYINYHIFHITSIINYLRRNLVGFISACLCKNLPKKSFVENKEIKLGQKQKQTKSRSMFYKNSFFLEMYICLLSQPKIGTMKTQFPMTPV